MDQGGCPITYIFVQLFTRENILGLIVIGAIYAACMVFAVMHSRQRALENAAE
jgi:PTS system galactitol-specific IIC component